MGARLTGQTHRRKPVGFFAGRGVTELKKIILIGSLLAFAYPAPAQDAFKPEQIKSGSGIYARHCAACHGPRMADPEGASDLRKFPRDQRERFVTPVSNGKNPMPPGAPPLQP